MRTRAPIVAALSLLAAISAAAQPRPILDPDDFVEPDHHDFPIFISRLVLGGMRSVMDDYRPMHQDAGFLLLTSSIYWSRFEIDLKHIEVRGENENAPADAQVCPCDPPIYFPTPPSPEETPNPPLPGSKDILQFAWYRSRPADPAEPPLTLRTRISYSLQRIDTAATYLDTGHPAFHLHGHEQSIGVEHDLFFRIDRHDVHGTLLVSRTIRSGTADDRSQNEITYVSHFQPYALGPVLLRGTLAIGGVTGRGANGVNVINPAFEAFVHNDQTGADFHLIWSPMATRGGAEGWVTHHQILISVERVLFLKLLASR